MFEVGKLTDESLDSFIAELGKVSTVQYSQWCRGLGQLSYSAGSALDTVLILKNSHTMNVCLTMQLYTSIG